MRGFEIVQHALRKYTHFSDDGGLLGEHVVDEYCGVRQDYARDRTVRDVSLVPERHVLVGSQHVGTHQTRQSTHLFAVDRVPFVGHRGTSTLLSVEWLLG